MPPRTLDFMQYPYPDTAQVLRYLETLSGVKDETERCIANLLHYRAARTRARFPRGPSAAVLVPLFVGRSGDLSVVLSRRSDGLRSFAGDTALPGGRVDVGDRTVEDAARREAFEEIGLPRDKARVPLLCVMEPVLAKGEILVTPVVVLILDHDLQPRLNSSEVTSIFARPLVSFLSSTPYPPGGRTANSDRPYHTSADMVLNDGSKLRFHKFLTGREAEGVKPVFGLTAAILIKTATIGYGRPPDFEVQPPDAPTMAQMIARAFLTPSNPIHVACEREGIDADRTAARLLRPPLAANAPRTIEWERIGTEWKKLMEGNNVTDVSSPQRVTAGKGGQSGSAPWDRKPGSEGVQKRAQGQANGKGDEGAEGLGAWIEGCKKQAREGKTKAEGSGGERKECGEAHWDDVPDMAKLGEFLDETRDMVNERMKEIKGDERKLAKARKAYPKILGQVKKQAEEARNGEGLFAMIPKEDQEGFKGGITAGKEGIEKEVGQMENGAEKDQSTEIGKEGARRGSEERKKYISEGGEVLSGKRNAKL